MLLKKFADFLSCYDATTDGRSEFLIYSDYFLEARLALLAMLLKKSVEFRAELRFDCLGSTFLVFYLFTLKASDSFNANSSLEKVILIAVGATLKVPIPLPRGSVAFSVNGSYYVCTNIFISSKA